MEIPLVNNIPPWLQFLIETLTVLWTAYIFIFKEALVKVIDKYGFLAIIIIIGLFILWIIVGIPIVLYSLIVSIVLLIYTLLQGRQKSK